MGYYLYILECSNNSYYIGYTTDIERRYQEHLQGSSKCKYTRSFPPKSLAVCWLIIGEKTEVLSVEKRLKKLSKIQKQRLVNHPKQLSDYIECDFAIQYKS
jgi:putative endonuclease